MPRVRIGLGVGTNSENQSRHVTSRTALPSVLNSSHRIFPSGPPAKIKSSTSIVTACIRGGKEHIKCCSLSLSLSLFLAPSLSLSLSYLFPLSLLPSISWFCILLCVIVSLFLHDQRQSRAIGQHARSFDHSLKLTFSPFMISWFFALLPQVGSLLLPPFFLHVGHVLFIPQIF